MQKMKEKFSRFFSEKSKVKSTFVSVVALVLALIISVSTVSAWVETISTIKVTGSGKIDTKLVTAANIQHTHADSIDLKKYFRKAGNVHLSEASSVDGKNFFFPVVSSSISSSTGQSKYRKGTVNDENVNYIKFSFKVSSSDAKDYGYRLNKVPTIKIGGQTVTNSTVRVAITDETAGGTTVLMAHAGSTTPIPSATDGSTSNTDVKAFSHYVDNDIFTVPKNSTHIITVILWLQDMNDGYDYYPLSGNKVEVTNFIIEPSIPKHKVKAIAVTDSVQSGTGGTVQVGSATAGATSQESVNDGGKVTLKASVKSGYKFEGWYTAATGGTRASQNTSYTVEDVTGAKTLYARFVTAYTVTAYAVSNGSSPNSNGGTVLVGSNTSSAATSKDTVAAGKETTFKAIVKDTYAFIGWFKAASGGTAVSTKAEYTVTINETTTLYARFVSTYKIIAHAVTDGTLDSATGGTVKITYDGTSTDASGKAEKTVNRGGSVEFTAAKVDGYTFEGWYDAETGGNKLVDGNPTTYTITNVTKAHIVYARFKQDVNYKIYFKASHWDVDDAWFAIHAWNSSGSTTIKMTSDGNGVYVADLGKYYKNVLFYRMDPSKTALDHTSAWNQTTNLTVPATNSVYTKNMFEPSAGGWTGTNGTWSVYGQ